MLVQWSFHVKGTPDDGPIRSGANERGEIRVDYHVIRERVEIVF